MQTRKLGKSDLEVSALGLGCMGMTGMYGRPRDKGEMIGLIHAAVDLGLSARLSGDADKPKAVGLPGLIDGAFGTRKWMSEAGTIGGLSRSDAKRASARENGRKGGRPKREAKAR